MDKANPEELKIFCSILKDAHFLVLPTEFDASPIVFCEASAYGVPSIATDVCGVIKTSDVKFINMVLIGNISILLSVIIFNVLRYWILLHITARVNIALISDYLIKLMKLPVTFFENKLLGDILQRAQDHECIRSFIMNNSLALIFSTFTFVIFAIILLIYNAVIFYIFLAGSILYVCWVLLFLSIRKKLDWEYFELLSRNQSYWVETVSAIQDVKIYNYEKHRRWKWEEIQARLYHVNKRVLAITNAQNLGAQFIESIKNMGIVFFCAMVVIKGDITFGVMVSTQFIIGLTTTGCVKCAGSLKLKMRSTPCPKVLKRPSAKQDAD